YSESNFISCRLGAPGSPGVKGKPVRGPRTLAELQSRRGPATVTGSCSPDRHWDDREGGEQRGSGARKPAQPIAYGGLRLKGKYACGLAPLWSPCLFRGPVFLAWHRRRRDGPMARLPHGISARSASWTLLAPLLALIFTLVAGLPGRTQTPPAAPEPPPAAPPPAAPPAAPALPPTAPALPASPPPPPNAPAAPAAPTPPTFELPEVEVAGKRPQLPSTTPASVSVITAEEIARLGALSVADVLRILPEVRVKDSGGPGSLTSVSIRGSSSTQVLNLLDG